MTAFVPTHVLKADIPQLRLKAGTPLRQRNPFAGDRPDDVLRMVEEGDHPGNPWLLTPGDVTPLPEWPEIRRAMMDDIAASR